MRRVLGIATAAAAALAFAASNMVRPATAAGPYNTGGNVGSFRHRDTKKHLSRSERNRRYKIQRAANRERRRLLQERSW